MYVVVAGGGIVGKGLAMRLNEARHDVVVIDIDSRVCEDLYARYGLETVNGSATSIDVLEAAGLRKADVAVAAMRNDADILAFPLLAHDFGVPRSHGCINVSILAARWIYRWTYPIGGAEDDYIQSNCRVGTPIHIFK